MQDFSAYLWREQVLADESLIASQKLILLTLAQPLEVGKGECEVTQEWLAAATALSVRVIRGHLAALDLAGWYTRKRQQYGVLYTALRGRPSDRQ